MLHVVPDLRQFQTHAAHHAQPVKGIKLPEGITPIPVRRDMIRPENPLRIIIMERPLINADDFCKFTDRKENPALHDIAPLTLQLLYPLR